MSGHVTPRATYVAIFAALMVLTGITVGVSFVNLGPFNFPVAVAIAVIKATLVVLFFMHVKYRSRLTKLIVSTGIFFLLTLFALTFTDYVSRGWMTAPPVSPAGPPVVAAEAGPPGGQ